MALRCRECVPAILTTLVHLVHHLLVSAQLVLVVIPGHRVDLKVVRIELGLLVFSGNGTIILNLTVHALLEPLNADKVLALVAGRLRC